MSMHKEIRYWDSCTFLALLNAESGRVAACTDTLRRAEKEGFVIITSALTLTEVLWRRSGPRLSEEKARILNRFFRRSYLRVANLSRGVAEQAQRLVWENGIQPKDAIHVATAIYHRCSMLETFDEPLIARSRSIANLAIREPLPADQGHLNLPAPSRLEKTDDTETS